MNLATTNHPHIHKLNSQGTNPQTQTYRPQTQQQNINIGININKTHSQT